MHSDIRLMVRFGLSALLLFRAAADAFYVPGIHVKTYSDGDPIPLFVNKAFSDNTQIQYAYSELPFVCPSSGRKNVGSELISGGSVALNIGEIFRGDRIRLSDYELVMGQDDEVHYLCSHQLDNSNIKKARAMITRGYVAEWIVDNLPGATSFVTVDKTRKYYAAGFKLGYTDVDPDSGKMRYFINNHVTMVIRYHRAPGKAGQNGKKVIVGFEVYPKSIGTDNRNDQGLPYDVHDVHNGMELAISPNQTRLAAYEHMLYTPLDDQQLYEGGSITVPYSYSVYFREEEHLEWKNRWDLYFSDQEDSSRIHWVAILNSIIILGLLTAVVAVILGRTIHGDILSFKESSIEDGKLKIPRPKKVRTPRRSLDKGTGVLGPVDDAVDGDVASDDEVLEDMTGWKVLHGDVFRTPQYAIFLAPLIGSGMQLLFMSTGLLALSCFGFLNPSYRGGFISVGLALFIFMGPASGYFSARIYKTFGGTNWQKNAFVTALFFPGLLFGTIFVLNLFVWAESSSTALPFGTLVVLIILWLLIQLPLVYVGSHIGVHRAGGWEHPVKPNPIARQIPKQSWYHKTIEAAPLAGLIPFAVIFVELTFVFKNLWLDKSGYYYVFGFLAVVSFILILSVMEVTIVATYILLCSENYNWWWHSFAVGGGSALWVFAYCVWYFFARLQIEGFVSSLLFFAYSFMACAVYGLLTGTVGFLTAYAFVRRIYSAIKVD